IIAFAVVVRWGIVAVAVAYVVRAYMLSPLPLLLVRRLIALDLGTYFRQFGPALIGSLAMSAAVLALKSAIARGLGLEVGMVLSIAMGIFVYVGILRRIAPTVVAEGVGYLRLVWPRRRWSQR